LTYNDLKKLSPNSNLFLKHSLYSVKARSKSQNRSSNQKNNQNEFDIQLRVKKFLKQNATSFKNHFQVILKNQLPNQNLEK
jgi:reverse gyrase